MLGCVAKPVRRAVRGYFWIANEFNDRSCKRLTVTRLYEQAVLAIPQNLRNVAYLCGDDRTAAGESLTQDDRRRFGAQRSYHHHIARRINVGCVPAVSGHNDFVGQSGLIDGVPYVDAAFQNPRALAYNREASIRTFL